MPRIRIIYIKNIIIHILSPLLADRFRRNRQNKIVLCDKIWYNSDMNKHLIRVIVICIVAVTALVLVSCKDTRSLSFDNDTYMIYLDTAPSLKPGVSVKPAKNGYTLSVRNDTIAKVESDGQTLKGLSEGITVLTAVSGEKQAPQSIYRTQRLRHPSRRSLASGISHLRVVYRCRTEKRFRLFHADQRGSSPVCGLGRSGSRI